MTASDMRGVSAASWLPALMPFNDYGGVWDVYLDALYAIFRRDFIESKPLFRGQRMGLKRHPVIDGKEATFWHLISEGGVESERTPDLRRCERICWSKVVIEQVPHVDVMVWSEITKGEERTYLWVEAAGYLVVLNKRKDYLLWTAFYVEYPHQRRKYTKRYERAQAGN